MLDEKKVKESKKRVEHGLARGDIIKEKTGRFSAFFLKNAQDSFDTDKLLYTLSTRLDLQKATGFPDFNGFL